MSPAARARSVWVRVESCYPTMRRSSWLSSLERSRHSTPGRIDLGLGRAPGTDMLTSRALRRDLETNAASFADDVLELRRFFEDMEPGQAVRAIPGTGLQLPLFILGSSLFGASVAAMLGLPFAFASHFAPDALADAMDVYRTRFMASRQLERPYTIVAANVVVADTDAQAQFSPD